MSTIYTDPPQSRNEAIIKSTIDGTQYTDPPQSRMEDLLLELKEAIEQGGGGGTTVVANPEGEATDDLEKLQVGSDIYEIPKDYEEMSNKPSINDVELDGNKTASELGLQAELDGAQTVEGNPITVTDAQPMNAESVVVELEPKQDLHGYDAPWVGGAGKNRLYIAPNTYTADDIVLEIDSSGVGHLAGSLTNTENYGFMVVSSQPLKAGTYILNGGNANGALLYLTDTNDTFITSTIDSDSQFTLEADTNIRLYIFVYLNHGSYNEVLHPMIRKSTESADFAPYSNICPITGYSEVNVERVGKNLFDRNQTFAYNGYISSDGTLTASIFWWTTDYQLIKSGTYTLSGVLSEGSGYYGICWFDENKNYISGFQAFTLESVSVNIPTTAKYIRYSVNAEALNTFQLELGNQATTYEPYQGDTYTVSLGGTKYGGTLDVTEGGYSDEWGTHTLDYVSLEDGLFTASAPNNVKSDVFAQAKCNRMKTWASVDDLDDNYGIAYSNNTFYMKLPPECGTTASEVDDWLGENPVSVVYLKKTPSSVSTTPTDIQLLENTNNVSTDGTNIQLKYQPNNVIGECKAYTDKKCSEVLPPLPTTDGTYHLSCEVTSGVGVLSWVSDS